MAEWLAMMRMLTRLYRKRMVTGFGWMDGIVRRTTAYNKRILR